MTVEELLSQLDFFFRDAGSAKEQGVAPLIEATGAHWDELSASSEILTKTIFRWGIILYKTKLVPEIYPILPKFISALSHPVATVRITTASSLGWMMRANPSFFDPAVVDQIVEMLHDQDDNVRAGVIFALQNIIQGDSSLGDKAIPFIPTLLASPNGRSRREILEFLKLMGRLRPQAVAQFIPKLEEFAAGDADDRIRIHSRYAAEAIKKGLRAQEKKSTPEAPKEEPTPPDESKM
jgi:HEAT repeat protein